MNKIIKEWCWEEPDHHYFVRILSDGRLEWGGWELYPKSAGGSVFQDPEEFLKTGKPGYDWMIPPENILEELRKELIE
ncbi:MAG: hypothetical protein PHV06_12075 [bacterium]|nr:hypothetical protein [bacterium]